MRFEMASTEIEKLKSQTKRNYPVEEIAEQAIWCFEEGFNRKTLRATLDNEFNGTARYSFSYKEIVRVNGKLVIKDFELLADAVWKNGRVETVSITTPDYAIEGLAS